MSKKISTIVDEEVWNEFKDLSEETHKSLSGMLTDAMKDYIRRKRVRPEFLKYMEASLSENEDLLKKLAE